MTEKALPERGFPDAEFVARAARAQAMMWPSATSTPCWSAPSQKSDT